MIAETVDLANRLNHDGINHLQNRDWVLCFRCFFGALKAVQRFLRSDRMGPVCCDDKGMSACKFERGGHLVIQGSQYFVFGSPLKVDLPGEPHPQHKNRRSLSLLAYAITYNLALSHHLWAVQNESPKNSRALLEAAATLYRHVDHLAHAENIPQTLMESMAIFNNMAHVFAALDALGNAERCTNHLYQCFEAFVENPELQGPSEVLDGFLSNLLHIVLHLDKAAAPAA